MTKMKFKLLSLLILVLTLVLTGCGAPAVGPAPTDFGSRASAPTEPRKPQTARFVATPGDIPVQGTESAFGADIILDRETGQQYLLVRYGDNITITPLLGKPQPVVTP